MGIYRLSNGIVRGAQVCRLFGANGARATLAWGTRPRQFIPARKSAEGGLQSEGEDSGSVVHESRFQRWWLSNPETPGALPQAGNETAPLAQRSSRVVRVAIGLLFLAIAPLPIFGAAKNRSAMHLPGYKAVPVHYGPMNKMIMSVRINGQPANLLVDTGASQLILDAEATASFGIRPSQRGLRYIRFTQINGQDLPVGFAQNITAGAMNFGSSPVALRSSFHSGSGTGHADGVLGLDILLGHKAVINCRTKLVFFKVDQGRGINLSSIASSGKFTRVPMQRE